MSSWTCDEHTAWFFSATVKQSAGKVTKSVKLSDAAASLKSDIWFFMRQKMKKREKIRQTVKEYADAAGLEIYTHTVQSSNADCTFSTSPYFCLFIEMLS